MKKKDPEAETKDLEFWTFKKTMLCCRKPLYWSCVWRFAQNCTDLIAPLIMKWYLNELKGTFIDGNPIDPSYWRCIIYAIAAVVNIMLSGALNERANFFKGGAKATAGQCIRSLVYKKISEADFMFTLNADTGLINRITMFEITGILDFLGELGEMISSPFIIIATFVLFIVEFRKANVLAAVPTIVFMLLMLFVLIK